MSGVGTQPLKIGCLAVRANVLSLVVLSSFSLCLVALYCGFPGFRQFLSPLQRLMADQGALAAFVSMAVFAGAIPWLFFMVDRSIRPECPGLTSFVQVLWRSLLGVACFWLYHAQDWLFGSELGWSTALKKMIIDQFVWTPLFLAPLDALFYFWAGRNFSFRRCRDEWPGSFVRGVVLPNLLTGWCIGIPTNLMVYFFPVDLRILVMGLIGSFWTLVSLQIGRRSGKCALR